MAVRAETRQQMKSNILDEVRRRGLTHKERVKEIQTQDGRIIGTFTQLPFGVLIHFSTSLAIAQHKSDCDIGRAEMCCIRKPDVLTVLRQLTYSCLSENPKSVRKIIRVTANDGLPAESVAYIEINLQPVNDITQVIRKVNDPVQFRQGSAASYATPLFQDCTLHDPDTFAFNSGYLKVDSITGGDLNGDQLGFLSLEEQQHFFNRDRKKIQLMREYRDPADSLQYKKKKNIPPQSPRKVKLINDAKQWCANQPERRKLMSEHEDFREYIRVEDNGKLIWVRAVKNKKPITVTSSRVSPTGIVNSLSKITSMRLSPPSSPKLNRGRSGYRASKLAQTAVEIKEEIQKEQPPLPLDSHLSSLPPEVHIGWAFLDEPNPSGMSSLKIVFSDFTIPETEDKHSKYHRNSISILRTDGAIPLEAVELCMWCISYSNTATKVKPGTIVYQLRVNGGDANTDGRFKLPLLVQPPYIWAPEYSKNKGYMDGDGWITVNNKITTNIVSGCLAEAALVVRSSGDSEPGDELKFDFSDGNFIVKLENLFHGKELVGTAITNDPSCLTINFCSSCKLANKAFASLLRSVLFRNEMTGSGLRYRTIDMSFYDTLSEDPLTLSTGVHKIQKDYATQISHNNSISRQVQMYVLCTGWFDICPAATVSDLDTSVFNLPATLYVQVVGPLPGDVVGLNPEKCSFSSSWESGSRVSLIGQDNNIGTLQVISPSQFRLMLVNCSLASLQLVIQAVSYKNSTLRQRNTKRTVSLYVDTGGETPQATNVQVELQPAYFDTSLTRSVTFDHVAITSPALAIRKSVSANSHVHLFPNIRVSSADLPAAFIVIKCRPRGNRFRFSLAKSNGLHIRQSTSDLPCPEGMWDKESLDSVTKQSKSVVDSEIKRRLSQSHNSTIPERRNSDNASATFSQSIGNDGFEAAEDLTAVVVESADKINQNMDQKEMGEVSIQISEESRHCNESDQVGVHSIKQENDNIESTQRVEVTEPKQAKDEPANKQQEISSAADVNYEITNTSNDLEDKSSKQKTEKRTSKTEDGKQTTGKNKTTAKPGGKLARPPNDRTLGSRERTKGNGFSRGRKKLSVCEPAQDSDVGKDVSKQQAETPPATPAKDPSGMYEIVLDGKTVLALSSIPFDGSPLSSCTLLLSEDSKAATGHHVSKLLKSILITEVDGESCTHIDASLIVSKQKQFFTISVV